MKGWDCLFDVLVVIVADIIQKMDVNYKNLIGVIVVLKRDSLIDTRFNMLVIREEENKKRIYETDIIVRNSY